MDPKFDQDIKCFLTLYGPNLEAHRPGCTSGQPTSLPRLIGQDSATIWITQVETDLATCAIPSHEWVYGGFLYLPEELRTRMKNKGVKSWKQTYVTWSWNQFKSDLRVVFNFFYGRRNIFLAQYRGILELNRQGCTVGKPTDLPELDKSNFSVTWIPAMQADFLTSLIPLAAWGLAGMLYLPDGVLRRIVSKERDRHWEKTGSDWSWEDFKTEVQENLDAMDLGGKILKGMAGVALGVIAGPPLIAAGLGALGFGAAGVAAGSTATAIQSVFYGGATTGLFSICQSIGATGAVGAAGTAISGVIGGLAAGRARR